MKLSTIHSGHAQIENQAGSRLCPLRAQKLLGRSEAKYDLRLKVKPGHREIDGWGTGAARSTDGMVRQSLGTTIGHGSLSGSTSYLRRP